MKNRKSILRAGILGSGFAAGFHFDAIQMVYGVKVEVLDAYLRTSVNLEIC